LSAWKLRAVQLLWNAEHLAGYSPARLPRAGWSRPTPRQHHPLRFRLRETYFICPLFGALAFDKIHLALSTIHLGLAVLRAGHGVLAAADLVALFRQIAPALTGLGLIAFGLRAATSRAFRRSSSGPSSQA